MKMRAAGIISLMMISMTTALFAIEIGEYSDPAKPIRSKAGKIVIITLKSNKTTGYEWQLSGPPDTKVVNFMKSEYVVDEPRLIGSGGTEIWSFMAVGQGEARVNLVYVRPWEKGVEPVDRVSFAIFIE